jgi:hypothetical protein
MRSAVLVAGLVGCVFAASLSPARAQIGYSWPYAELLQKADLVVIAESQNTFDTGRRRLHPELKPAYPVIELQSVFLVSAVLKGNQAVRIGADLRVRHYRYTDEVRQRGLVNAGFWLRLDPHCEYLLFLRRAADGFYEPLSGHTLPNDSVYLLDRNSASMFNEDRTWACPGQPVK